MRIAVLLVLASLVWAQNSVQKSFEQNYLILQKKLEVLKQKGEKVGAKSEQEMNDLLAQMNHEHTELKRELEKRNQEIKSKVSEGRKTVQDDWSKRFSHAYGEFSAGLKRTWNALSHSDGPAIEKDSLDTKDEKAREDKL